MAKIKVMVVDDSPTDLKLMSGPFLSKGYELITATNGEDALRKAESMSSCPSSMVLKSADK